MVGAAEGVDADNGNPDVTFRLVGPVPVLPALPLLAGGLTISARITAWRKRR